MDRMITEKTVKNRIGRRNKEIHKGDCGRILIAAGSWGMAGAAILAARSALRAGAGLVRLAIPEALFPIVQGGWPIPYDFFRLWMVGVRNGTGLFVTFQIWTSQPMMRSAQVPDWEKGKKASH